MTELSARLNESSTQWVSSPIKDWSPGWKDNYQAWLQPSLDLVGDTTWGGTIRDLVQLPVEDPSLWANRLIELPGGHCAVTGIRFRNRDISKPFVDIIATTASPDAAGFELLGQVLAKYRDFQPLCLRLNVPELNDALRITETSPTNIGSAHPDLLILARPVTELLAEQLAPAYQAVSLRPCPPSAAAARTFEIYNELEASRPQLREWAVPADAQSLEGAASEDLLFEILVDGNPSGVIAAERTNAYGFTGFCMQEIAIDSSHRGRGIGVAALQHLLRKLPANEHDVLWGHIHPDNLPSLRNAQASGRQIVSAHIWFTPPGYSGMNN